MRIFAFVWKEAVFLGGEGKYYRVEKLMGMLAQINGALSSRSYSLQYLKAPLCPSTCWVLNLSGYNGKHFWIWSWILSSDQLCFINENTMICCYYTTMWYIIYVCLQVSFCFCSPCLSRLSQEYQNNTNRSFALVFIADCNFWWYRNLYTLN